MIKICLRNRESGKYIGLDSSGTYSSGGYPYETDAWTAHGFISEDDARDYALSFPKEKWEIAFLAVSVEWTKSVHSKKNYLDRK